MKHLTLTLSLILGLTTSVSADNHLPTAGEILRDGKILHKEVHLKRDHFLYDSNSAKILGEHKTDVELIVYHVMHHYDYYSCWARGKFEHASGLHYVTCAKLTQGETYEPED